MRQPDLFDSRSAVPTGFRYHPEVIDDDDERRLCAEMAKLQFRPFDFHGFLGKRRVISFGWRYDFGGGGLQEAGEIPGFLTPIRARAAACFGIPAATLTQVLLTEYPAGATIGWHKDRSVFGDVIGISLLSACTFRFRKRSHTGWSRSSVLLERRSGYLLQGPARSEWEHSIPAVENGRYSITFRTLR